MTHKRGLVACQQHRQLLQCTGLSRQPCALLFEAWRSFESLCSADAWRYLCNHLATTATFFAGFQSSGCGPLAKNFSGSLRNSLLPD